MLCDQAHKINSNILHGYESLQIEFLKLTIIVEKRQSPVSLMEIFDVQPIPPK